MPSLVSGKTRNQRASSKKHKKAREKEQTEPGCMKSKVLAEGAEEEIPAPGRNDGSFRFSVGTCLVEGR